MKNKNQLFAKSYQINFTDYNREKKAITILKAVKREDPNTIIKYYFSYNDFIILTKAYFKYLKNKRCIYMKPPQSLLDTNTSNLIFNKVEEHLNQCHFCHNSDDLCAFDCDQLKGILYPYGKYETTEDDCDNMRFPVPIDLSKWCINPDCPKEEKGDGNKSRNGKAEAMCDCSGFAKTSALFV
jgi:hypothetical protein